MGVRLDLRTALLPAQPFGADVARAVATTVATMIVRAGARRRRAGARVAL